MLNNVPKGLNSITRNVVIRHPNTFNAEFYRRTVKRDEPIEGERQTMGGMMVLTVDDEVEIDWAFMGTGYALVADHFQPAFMMDRGDANNGAMDEYRFLIEPELETYEGGFILQKNDVFYIVLGDIQDINAPRIAYEIIGIETTVNVPPFVPRYVCNRRDDLVAQMKFEEHQTE